MIGGTASPSLALTTIINTGIIAGAQYEFRIRVANVYGYSDWSPISTIQAATIPGTITSIGVQIVGTFVQISWSQPTSNYASISMYDIEIKGKDNSYYQELTDCNGANSLIIATKSCMIPMANFLLTPISLVF